MSPGLQIKMHFVRAFVGLVAVVASGSSQVTFSRGWLSGGKRSPFLSTPLKPSNGDTNSENDGNAFASRHGLIDNQDQVAANVLSSSGFESLDKPMWSKNRPFFFVLPLQPKSLSRTNGLLRRLLRSAQSQEITDDISIKEIPAVISPKMMEITSGKNKEAVPGIESAAEAERKSHEHGQISDGNDENYSYSFKPSSGENEWSQSSNLIDYESQMPDENRF
ncbi:unnamed protein product [Notodromas monacha]|uniref:Uncharacterized protein n=1 Tax=Notodromas monacha TaxID=399045 RepID=A0A7R9GIT9_9CRUS|nr:unnamed protein product [Notodromas monacha]CAG0922805.1 unnamed protein product [Notodromas monacha]